MKRYFLFCLLWETQFISISYSQPIQIISPKKSDLMLMKNELSKPSILSEISEGQKLDVSNHLERTYRDNLIDRFQKAVDFNVEMKRISSNSELQTKILVGLEIFFLYSGVALIQEGRNEIALSKSVINQRKDENIFIRNVTKVLEDDIRDATKDLALNVEDRTVKIFSDNYLKYEGVQEDINKLVNRLELNARNEAYQLLDIENGNNTLLNAQDLYDFWVVQRAYLKGYRHQVQLLIYDHLEKIKNLENSINKKNNIKIASLKNLISAYKEVIVQIDITRAKSWPALQESLYSLMIIEMDSKNPIISNRLNNLFSKFSYSNVIPDIEYKYWIENSRSTKNTVNQGSYTHYFGDQSYLNKMIHKENGILEYILSIGARQKIIGQRIVNLSLNTDIKKAKANVAIGASMLMFAALDLYLIYNTLPSDDYQDAYKFIGNLQNKSDYFDFLGQISNDPNNQMQLIELYTSNVEKFVSFMNSPIPMDFISNGEQPISESNLCKFYNLGEDLCNIFAKY